MQFYKDESRKTFCFSKEKNRGTFFYFYVYSKWKKDITLSRLQNSKQRLQMMRNFEVIAIIKGVLLEKIINKSHSVFVFRHHHDDKKNHAIIFFVYTES